MSPEDKLKGKPRKGRLWFNTTCKHQCFVHTSELHTAVSTMSSVPETQPPPFVPVLYFNPAHNTDGRTERGVPCRHLFWFLYIYILIRVQAAEDRGPGVKLLSYSNAGFPITFCPYKVVSHPYSCKDEHTEHHKQKRLTTATVEQKA